MAIRRYLGIESVNYKGEPIKLGHWCASEDVEKLEATLAERDAEIERLTEENETWNKLHNQSLDDSEKVCLEAVPFIDEIKQLKAERDGLMKKNAVPLDLGTLEFDDGLDD